MVCSEQIIIKISFCFAILWKSLHCDLILVFMSGKSQTIAVSQPSQIFPTNENQKS